MQSLVPGGSLHILRRFEEIVGGPTASEFLGAGSQQRQARGDAKPHPATVTAGERHMGPRLAPPGDGPGLYGMQEARGSSPLSSTFTQVKGLLLALE